MRLMSSKLIYFIPFGQDNPYKKPTSLVANMDLLVPTVHKALNRQTNSTRNYSLFRLNMLKYTR